MKQLLWELCRPENLKWHSLGLLIQKGTLSVSQRINFLEALAE